MSMVVGVAQAHNRLSELIDQALSGTDVMIARRGEPAVKLVPVSAASEALPSGAAIAARMADRLADRSGAAHAVTEDDLAAHIERERESWQ
ncbi:MAG: type II toxin-antitoxin system prevent-host-death family antitoxin [Bifidobacteriaceae bacterium]|jgi:prevent-host-death family protein|nr:type II toxin-antitoxin system prevent-host-death family antitoxin [Bifidobacteriaceae bacterium]